MALPNFNAQALLPEGVHPATAGDLKDRFVTPFPASGRRQKVFGNFCRYQAAVAALGVHATQWVDGSFVDQSRLEPDNVDAVNFCEFSALNALSPAAQLQITPLLDGRESTKTAYDTHTFLVIRFLPGIFLKPASSSSVNIGVTGFHGHGIIPGQQKLKPCGAAGKESCK